MSTKVFIQMVIKMDTMMRLLKFLIRCILRMIISITTNRIAMLIAVRKVYTFLTVFFIWKTTC